MSKRMAESASIRAAQEFTMLVHHLKRAAISSRPASAWRLEQAAHQILHFAIHANTQRRPKARRWRLQHALRAGESARRCLARIAKVDAHRVLCSAGVEVLDRLMTQLNAEREANEKGT